MQSSESAHHPITIDENLVRQLIAEQFPHWQKLPIRPVAFSGWDNRTFHLGENMSVRLPSAAWYADQVAKEQQWLPILAPLLPLPIPAPLAMGSPSPNYPWQWSIYQWIDGENPTLANLSSLDELAMALGQFLVALQQIDAAGGPLPGEHNFFRGAPLAVYEAETRDAIRALGDAIDSNLATELWEAGVRTTWNGEPVWVHGDMAVGNLLVRDGRLCAVIDFGCLAIGDPACDLTIAWTLFSGASRDAFRATVALDSATWARARGWALWKALITLAEHMATDSHITNHAQRVLNALFEEYRHTQ